MERRIQRPVLDLQHTLRTLLNDVGDGVAVGRAEQERPQNQDVERALDQLAVERRCAAFGHRLFNRHIPIDNLPLSTVPERTPRIAMRDVHLRGCGGAALWLFAGTVACGGRANVHPCGFDEQDRSAECRVVPVFENETTRDGRRIDIHVTVLRATSRGTREAVLVLAGGPGEPGSAMRGIADGWLAPIRDAADVVFVDQRGTGESHALPCPTTAATDPASAFGHIFDPLAVRQCRQRLETEADLTQYTTDAAAADLDEVRAALGYAQVSLYGVSYGTRLAQAYMRRFPGRVRVAVLDGVLPFGEAVVSYARSLQEALDRTFSACGHDPRCRRVHPHLPEDLASLQRRLAMASLRATVTTSTGLTVAVQMTAGDFDYSVRGILYRPQGWTELPDMIGRAVESGDLSEFAQRYWERAVGIDGRLALGLHLSVLCAEDVAFATAAAANAAAAGTVLGRYVFDEYRRACAEWPRATIPDDSRRPVDARVPTVLVSGYFDPVTPPEFAERVARWLPLNLQIVSPSTAHGSASQCPSSAIIGALRSGGVQGLPRVCQ
jgi:pimeloyl-ACP methyl ester carboxylesterase